MMLAPTSPFQGLRALCVVACLPWLLATRSEAQDCKSVARDDQYGSLAGVVYYKGDPTVTVPNIHFKVQTVDGTTLAVVSSSGTDGKFLIEKILPREVIVLGFGLFRGEPVFGQTDPILVLTQCRDLADAVKAPPNLKVVPEAVPIGASNGASSRPRQLVFEPRLGKPPGVQFPVTLTLVSAQTIPAQADLPSRLQTPVEREIEVSIIVVAAKDNTVMGRDPINVKTRGLKNSPAVNTLVYCLRNN